MFNTIAYLIKVGFIIKTYLNDEIKAWLLIGKIN